MMTHKEMQEIRRAAFEAAARSVWRRLHYANRTDLADSVSAAVRALADLGNAGITMLRWINIDDALPPAAGWYAVGKCWDPEEGTFPDAGHWDGKNWSVSSFPPAAHPIITRSSRPLPTEEMARDWAEKNAPDWW